MKDFTPQNRREFLDKVTKLGMLSILPVSPFLSQKEKSITTKSSELLEVGPYLQNLTSDGITVMWTTTRNTFAWVEYGQSFYLHKKAFEYVGGLIQANNRIHRVRIQPLDPGVRLKYRVVSVEILDVKGSRYEFGEPQIGPVYEVPIPVKNEEEVSVAILNDHHEIESTIPELLYRFGYKGNDQDFDLVVFNGDVFNNTESEAQIKDQFITPCVNVFASHTPLLFVQGNHEVRGAAARTIPNYFDFPANKFYHTFDRGPVKFLVLDAGEDKADDNWEYGGLAAFDRYREEQRAWLEEEIKKDSFKNAKYRVLLIHISPWHTGNWHGTLHGREMFGDLLNRAHIDVQISGHTHRYMYHDPDEDHNFPIFIGGGPQKGGRTLIKLHADQKELKIEMWADSGELVKEKTLPFKS